MNPTEIPYLIKKPALDWAQKNFHSKTLAIPNGSGYDGYTLSVFEQKDTGGQYFLERALSRPYIVLPVSPERVSPSISRAKMGQSDVDRIQTVAANSQPPLSDYDFVLIDKT